MHQPKIYVAGHQGMVGSAILRVLQSKQQTNIVTRSRSQLDLVDQAAVRHFFEQEKPDQVYIAAGRVGGILANSNYPADFIYQNLMIQANIIDAAFRSGVKKMLVLGSSCIYPKLAVQPMPEGALLTGPLEPTNEPYAIAKIAGIKLCESYNRQYGKSHGIDYRSVMPTNLYGPGDNYHPENAHVIPALIQRIDKAKRDHAPSVMIWGSGSQRREFLFVSDMAKACVHLMHLDRDLYKSITTPMSCHINIGFGTDLAIGQAAKIIAETVGYTGQLTFDTSKPDGAPRKLLDSSLIRQMGWTPEVSFREGIKLAYTDYLQRGLGH